MGTFLTQCIRADYSLAWPRPGLVYGDASGFGRLGAIIYVGGQTYAFSAHVPECGISSQCGVYDSELAAALVRVGGTHLR